MILRLGEKKILTVGFIRFRVSIFEPMSRKSTIFFYLACVLSMYNIQYVEAQREYIVVEKTLSNKQIKFSSGDKITYKLWEEDIFRTDHIVALNDTSIEFHYTNIQYKDIAEVDIKGKKFSSFDLKSAGGKVQIAGVALIAIDAFNQVVVRGEEATFNQGIWIIGGSLFLGGSIMRWATPKKVKLGGKYKIRYMNLNY